MSAPNAYRGWEISPCDSPVFNWVADRGEAEDGERIFAANRAELFELIDEALELEEA